MPTIIGTSGNDTLTGTADADTIEGGEGSDGIYGLGGDDILNGGDETGGYSTYGDGIDGGAGNDQINGGAGNDTLMGGTGRDIIRGGSGNDRITGGGGSISAATAFAAIPGLPGTQQITYFGLIDPLTDDNEVDTLYGEDGDDTIYAGLGDVADGGDGTDTLYASFRRGTVGLNLDLSTNANAVLATALGGTISNFELFGVAGTDFRDVVIGTSLSDTLSGYDGDDDLRGGAGNDYLSGGNGHDRLDGGEGNDSIEGGAGRDTIFGGDGNDVVTTSEGFSVILWDANGRRVSGASLDDGEVDTIDLGAGDDTAYVGFGDIAEGGEGTDTVHVSLARRSSAVSLDLRGADAMAQLNAAVGGGLSGFEVIGNNITLTGFNDTLIVARGGNYYGLAGDDRITGNADVQFLGGNDGDDYLDGQGGNDRLWGGSGHDTLLGGDGADYLYGDEDNDNALNGVLQGGDDILDGGAGNDFIWGGGGSDRIQGGDGNDQIWGDSHTVATFTLSQIQGGADVIDGGAGNDQIWGETGNDVLRGGLGNDYLNGGDGIDAAVYSGLRRQYVANQTSVSGNGEGTDSLVSIENVVFVDGTLTFDASSASAQVMRLYSATLNRTPDQTGLEANVAGLAQIGLLGLANIFVQSAEFQDRFGALNNQQFVEQMYRFALGREGDAAGIAAWVAVMNGGATRGQMVVSFSESAEHQARTAGVLTQGLWAPDAQAQIIARMYDATFDRLPDVGGLAAWTAALKAGTPLIDVAAAFAGSVEFQSRYGNVSNEQFVRQMYQFCLDREPDAGGLAVWTAALNSGTSRAQMLLNFSESAEHIALTAGLWLGGIRFAGYVGAPALDDETTGKGQDDAHVLPGAPDGDVHDPIDLDLMPVIKDGNDAFVLPPIPDGGLAPWAPLVDHAFQQPVHRNAPEWMTEDYLATLPATRFFSDMPDSDLYRDQPELAWA